MNLGGIYLSGKPYHVKNGRSCACGPDLYLDVRSGPTEINVDAPADWGEFDRIGKKVPDYLSQMRRVSSDLTGFAVGIGA